LAAAYITDNLCTKNGNSSFFKLKIRGLLTRAASNQEWLMMERVRYLDCPHNRNEEKSCEIKLLLRVILEQDVCFDIDFSKKRESHRHRAQQCIT
jgi:hypothetical protein